jgi:nicotinic acid mononucleotide adenylyltransferase
MYTFDTLSKAEAEYHKNLATIGSDNLKSIMCMVIAEDGTQHFCRYWKADKVVEETA